MRSLVLGYEELKLRIHRADPGSYRVFASTRSAEVSTSFELPFREPEIENFILKVSHPRGRRRVASSAIGDARRFGGRLFKALFREEILTLYRDALFQARGQSRGVRITLCLSESPELIDVPWEYLFDDPDFLAVSAFTPVVRYLDLPRGHRPLLVEPPLRLLGVVSSPAQYELLDVERERSNLESALSELRGSGAIELHWLERPTLGGLLRALQVETFHGLHYIGHGAYDGDTETGVLLFEDDAGWARPVSGDKLGMIVHDFSSLRLTVLNACEGARTGRTDPFAGVAGSLVRRDIPAVVAMQFEISDEAAIVFAGGFYRPLAAGAPVDTSLAAARLAMLAERSDDIEWGTPVLFMRVPDGRLFDLREQREQTHTRGEEPGAATGATAAAAMSAAAAGAGAERASIAPARGNAAATVPTGRRAVTEPKEAFVGQRGRRRLLVAGAVAVVVVIVAGVVALNPGGPHAARNTLTASAPPFKLTYHKPWRKVAGRSGLIAGRMGLVSGDATLTAGELVTSAAIPGGAPPALMTSHRRPDVSVNAQVAGHDGRAYTWLSSRGQTVAYVLPTSAGDAAVICQGPASSAVVLQACGQMAMHAHVSGVTTIPPGPDAKLGTEIAHPLQVVQTSRTNVGNLGGNPNARARQAKGIARTESEAATTLKELATPVRYQRVVAQLATALEEEAKAFTALAGVASAQKPGAYPSSVSQVVGASRGLADATRGLAAAYQLKLPSLRVLSLDRSLPAAPPTPRTPPPTTTVPTTTTTPSTPTAPGTTTLSPAFANPTPPEPPARTVTGPAS